MRKDDDMAEAPDRELAELLKSYPAPAADPGFFDAALAHARREGRRRQRNRRVFTGIGSAIAAGLAAWFVATGLLSTPVAPAVPAVTMTLAEPRTVNLVFATNETMDVAMLTVTLPAGVEMQGFPGQRQVAWETSLRSGRNLLPLTLVATSPAGGEILATLQHEDRGRTFRLKLDIG